VVEGDERRERKAGSEELMVVVAVEVLESGEEVLSERESGRLVGVLMLSAGLMSSSWRRASSSASSLSSWVLTTSLGSSL